MNTHTEFTEAATNGGASPTSTDGTRSIKRSSSFDIIYAGAYGFVVGFCIAAGIGIILVYAVKAMEGLDGE